MLVHDAESEDMAELGVAGNVTLRVNQALVETDLVVTATAAETVLNGGPAALLSASGRDSLRAAGALSLLETSASQGWRLAVEIERRLAERVAVTGVSLVLNPPRVSGPFAGYPHDEAAVERLLGSRARRLFQLAPGHVRQRALERLPREQTASAVFGGTPSVAHAEALLRGTVFKGIELDEPVDALVIGIPPTTPFMPRERPNPVSAAYLGLGPRAAAVAEQAADRAGRDGDPRAPVSAALPAPDAAPYRALFFDPRTARDIGAMRDAEAAAAHDARAIEDYRAGHACHPLQPFVEWSACDASAHRLGAVLIAGCRDAHAARQLGFVPVHRLGAALEMARGRGAKRIGYLLAPPYVPHRGRRGQPVT